MGAPRPEFTERIHVYADERGELHTDHRFCIWGRPFRRLRYLCDR